MYIRKTKTRSINNTNHFTYRLVESRRDPVGKVKQHTLLNLGAHYSIIEESDLPLLSQRIENIITGQQSLLPLTDNLETEAQRIANLVIKKHAKPLIYDDKNDRVQYREVDIGTIENSDIKTVGSEHLAYETAKKINLIGILSECGLSEKEINSAMATIIGRLIAPGSEVSTVKYLRNNSALDEILATDFSNLHKKSIQDFLKAHYSIQNEFSTAFSSSLIKARAVELVQRLHKINEILVNLRANIIQIGGEQIVTYLTRSMLMGTIYEYADLNRIPPSAFSGRNMPPGSRNTNAAADPSDSFGEIHQSLKVISSCARRFAFEAKKYTDKEVRELIKQREEVEKQDWIQKLKGMTKEERQQEMRNKKLGLGAYAVGGSRDIYTYRASRWDQEQAERARYGHTDFEYPGVGPEGYAQPQGRPTDGNGFPIYNLPGAQDAGDYSHTQRNDEDY